MTAKASTLAGTGMFPDGEKISYGAKIFDP